MPSSSPARTLKLASSTTPGRVIPSTRSSSSLAHGRRRGDAALRRLGRARDVLDQLGFVTSAVPAREDGAPVVHDRDRVGDSKDLVEAMLT